MANTLTRAFIAPSKYYQGPGEINRLEEYSSLFGPNVLAVTGETFYSRMCEKLPEIYKQTNSNVDIIIFDAKQYEVSYNQINKAMDELKSQDYDVVIGIGGGKVLDFAKAIAWKLDAAIIIFPTSVSSDAPTSAFSVIYNDEGVYQGLQYYKKNPDIVLLDTDIISKAPVRLFVAGMGDALSTYIEVRACIESNAPNLVGTGYGRTLSGLAIARASYDVIFEQGLKAKIAVENGLCNKAVEDVIEANTLMSGIGFECNGAAGAHGFHDGLTNIGSCRENLHGELVAFGIMCQLFLENREYAEMDKTCRFLIEVGLPVTLADVGYTDVKEAELRNVAKKMIGSLHMDNEPFTVTEAMIYDAILGGDAMGRHFKKRYLL